MPLTGEHCVPQVWFESIAPPGRIIDRVPHDFQRIVPDFRTDQIALPSDQVSERVSESFSQSVSERVSE